MELKQLKSMSKKELKEYREELEKQAKENFIETSKFDIYAWLCGEDRLDYERINFLLGDSDFNPDEK